MTLPQVLDLTSDALALLPAAIAMWITLRVLRFPDLSIEYAVAFAAFVFVAAGRNQGDWRLALGATLGAGLLLACCMGLLVEYGRLPGILVALVAAYALYSLSLLVLGAPNASVDAPISVVNRFGGDTRLTSASFRLMLPGAVAIPATLLNAWLVSTVMGQNVVAVGANRLAAQRCGIPAHRLAVCGMSWAGVLVGLSGFLAAQTGGYVDIGMGTGLLAVFLIAISVARAATALLAPTSQGARRFQFELFFLGLAMIGTRFLVAIALKMAVSPAAVRLVVAIELLALAVLLRRHVTDL